MFKLPYVNKAELVIDGLNQGSATYGPIRPATPLQLLLVVG